MAKHTILLGPVIVGEQRHETGEIAEFSESDVALLSKAGVIDPEPSENLNPSEPPVQDEVENSTLESSEKQEPAKTEKPKKSTKPEA